MEIKYRLLIYIVYDKIYGTLHASTGIMSTGSRLLYGERRTSFGSIDRINDDRKREANVFRSSLLNKIMLCQWMFRISLTSFISRVVSVCVANVTMKIINYLRNHKQPEIWKFSIQIFRRRQRVETIFHAPSSSLSNLSTALKMLNWN